MTRSRIVKSLTLSSFIIFLSGFVAFKSGTFDKYLQSEEKSILPSMFSASVTAREALFPESGRPAKQKYQLERRSPDMMSTSKSFIVTDQELKFYTKSSPEMMWSSKSMVITDEEWQIAADDSEQIVKSSPEMMWSSEGIPPTPQPKFQVEQKYQFVKRSPEMMSTSKSMVVTGQELEFPDYEGPQYQLINSSGSIFNSIESAKPSAESDSSNGSEAVKRSPEMMRSSKSIVIIGQEQKIKIASDKSLKRLEFRIDSMRKADSLNRTQAVKRSPEMMSSSKSRAVIDQKLQFQIDSVLKADSLKKATGK